MDGYWLDSSSELSQPVVGDTTRRVLATAETTAGDVVAFESIYEQGASAPLHVHPDATELFYVLEGEIAYYLDGEWFDATAGAFVAAPRGCPHGFKVASARARTLVVFSPATMLGLFEAQARGELPDDPAARSEAVREHGMIVLGPLPLR